MWKNSLKMFMGCKNNIMTGKGGCRGLIYMMCGLLFLITLFHNEPLHNELELC